MYVPSDDTFLLAECIGQYSGRWALEIGVGSGVLLNLLEKRFVNVAGSDIDMRAIEHCRRRSRAMLVCCDAATAFAGIRFDLIVSNPPYLPDDEIKDKTIHGGPRGIETTIHFIESGLPLIARGGKMLLVVSSLADSAALHWLIVEKKIRMKKLKEKRIFLETLSVIELSP